MAQNEREERPSGEAVAAFVRSRIGWLDLTQSEVAERAGMSEPTLSRRLHGGAPFTMPEVFALAKVLEVSPREIVAAGEAVAS